MSCMGPNKVFFLNWVKGNYGKNSRTKTVTNEKYDTICRYISGKECKVNAKFRYWVRSKGFRLFDLPNIKGQGEQTSGRKEAVLHVITPTKQGDNDEIPLDCPFQNGIKRNGYMFRRVATVENFYEIIQAAHVNESGSHAGQKKTYKMVSSAYAFLPREVVTFYLLNCDVCKPRIEKYGPVASRSKANRRYSCDTRSTSDEDEEEWEEMKELRDNLEV